MHSRASSSEPPVPADPYVALDVKIPSDVREIERVVRLVTDQCQTLHLPERVCSFNIPVALTEALANAILRGNRAKTDSEVRLRTVVSADTLTFDVIDQGPGFDLDDNIREPAAGNLEREDGRGLFLMRELMDSLEQFRAPDDGNVVRMTIHR